MAARLSDAFPLNIGCQSNATSFMCVDNMKSLICIIAKFLKDKYEFTLIEKTNYKKFLNMMSKIENDETNINESFIDKNRYATPTLKRSGVILEG